MSIGIAVALWPTSGLFSGPSLLVLRALPLLAHAVALTKLVCSHHYLDLPCLLPSPASASLLPPLAPHPPARAPRALDGVKKGGQNTSHLQPRLPHAASSGSFVSIITSTTDAIAPAAPTQRSSSNSILVFYSLSPALGDDVVRVFFFLLS